MFSKPVQRAVNAPQSPLERQLIIDYLAEKGYRLEDMKMLPADLAKELMTGACTYASLRLAEIESRSHFVRKIHYER
jgi:hypothetical protein